MHRGIHQPSKQRSNAVQGAGGVRGSTVPFGGPIGLLGLPLSCTLVSLAAVVVASPGLAPGLAPSLRLASATGRRLGGGLIAGLPVGLRSAADCASPRAGEEFFRLPHGLACGSWPAAARFSAEYAWVLDFPCEPFFGVWIARAGDVVLLPCSVGAAPVLGNALLLCGVVLSATAATRSA